ncbi:MAG: 7-carboxy-7-deazaguanine synthase QueE, partial [Myxococcota bacterium]
WENLELLSSRDEIKIVLAGRADYEWARDQVRARELHLLCRAVTLSPVHGALCPRDLAGWILEDELLVRLGLQIHRYLDVP